MKTNNIVLANLDRFYKSFNTLGFFIFIGPVIPLCITVIAISLIPGTLLCRYVFFLTKDLGLLINVICLSFSLACAFVLYGVSIIFIAPLFNFLLPFKVKPVRGPWYSLISVPWYYHNALTYIVRYTFLEFITPSPVNNVFFKLMGMKIGKGVMINTTRISDPCLITLEDNVLLGGSVTMFSHYAMKGYLIIDRVHLKKGANVGLGATIMGNVIIGEDARIMPHAVILPGARIDDKTTVPDIKYNSLYVTKKEE